MSDSEKLKPLFERGIARTLPQQIQHHYLILLMHLETLLAEVNDMVHDCPDDEDLQRIYKRLIDMHSKNIRLKHKITYGQQH